MKVRVTSNEMKRMLDDDNNPATKSHGVDVDVTESEGRPARYKILDLEDLFDRDETAA